jgi:hypothetical protein
MIVEKDYIELDNFLPTEVQDKIERLLTHPSFPWAFVYDAVGGYTGESGTDGAAGFFHNLIFNSKPRSSDLPSIMPIAHAMEAELANVFKVVNYNRIRVGLFTRHPDDTPHTPHTDAQKPHWTGVYYVNNCDGDLVLYEETYDDILEDAAKTKPLTIKKRFTPGKGKMVLFNGKHYHSSSFPTKTPLRIAITFNFEVE